MIPDDRRTLVSVTTLVLGLLVTCALSYSIYTLEQERARRALIASASAVGETLEGGLREIAAVPDLLVRLPDDAAEALRAVLPYLIVRPAADSDAAVSAANYPNQDGIRSGAPRTGLDAQGLATTQVELFIRKENRLRQASVDLRFMLDALLRPFADAELQISLHDLRPSSNDAFYRNRLSVRPSGVAEAALPAWLDGQEYRSGLTFLDRDWLLSIRPLAAFGERHTTFLPLILFIGGTVVSLLLGFVVHQRDR